MAPISEKQLNPLGHRVHSIVLSILFFGFVVTGLSVHYYAESSDPSRVGSIGFAIFGAVVSFVFLAHEIIDLRRYNRSSS